MVLSTEAVQQIFVDRKIDSDRWIKSYNGQELWAKNGPLVPLLTSSPLHSPSTAGADCPPVFFPLCLVASQSISGRTSRAEKQPNKNAHILAAQIRFWFSFISQGVARTSKASRKAAPLMALIKHPLTGSRDVVLCFKNCVSRIGWTR